MGVMQRLIGAYLRRRVRARADGKTLDQLADQLTASRDALMPRILGAADSAWNREAINHWVGIERWSLDRIRQWRHPPTELGSYRPFRGPEGSSLEDLQEAFARTRQESIALAREMARQEDVDLAVTIPHNDLGPLTVTEWFEYIDDHSMRERLRLRGQ